jgi:PIN domain nuclease of toxin-antitoxin system
MNFLLDTCTFLWLATDPTRLSAAANVARADPGNTFTLSAVSAWEIGVLFSLGRLALSQPPVLFVPQERQLHRIGVLELSEDAATHVSNLPQHHRDPFDRMLVCQALIHGLTILTPDPVIRQYAVPTLW